MTTQKILSLLTALFLLCGLTATAHAASVSGQGTWETTLLGRDLDGNAATVEAYYDTVLDITWLADANYAQTSGYDSDGEMNWADANAWAAGLNIDGVTGWRLPDTAPVDGVAWDHTGALDGSSDYGYNISAPGSAYPGSTGNELAYMYYNNLGNLGYWDTDGIGPQSGWDLNNPGPFANVQSDNYWTGTASAQFSDNALYNDFYYGRQYLCRTTCQFHAWAVHDGSVGVTVSSVPIPAAFWLFSSGLIGLISIAKRKIQGVAVHS